MVSVTIMDSAPPPPPFLTKTYDMVDDSLTDSIVSWSPTCCNSFVVWDFYEFSRSLLPQYFKHNNFSSFVRQLNTYGFRKSDPDRWEFLHEEFVRDQRHRLRNIHRKKSMTSSSSSSTSATSHAHGLVNVSVPPQAWTFLAQHQQPPTRQAESEVEQLRRERNAIMMELGRLGAQHHTAHQQIKRMSDRLQAMEIRQQHIVAFVARTMSTPFFYQHGNQVIAVDGSRVQQKLLEDCLNDRNSDGARKRRCIMYSDQPGSGNAVVADCSMDYNQRQQQFAEEHASSCEINQETATSVMTSDDQETAGSYDHKLLVELNDSNALCSDNLNMQGGSNGSQIFVIQNRPNTRNDGTVSTTSCSGILEDVQRTMKMKVKQPVISEGNALSMEAEEHLQVVDLNLQPLSICDDFHYLPSSRDWLPSKCLQAGASNSTFFEDLESELFWEHLLSLPVSI